MASSPGRGVAIFTGLALLPILDGGSLKRFFLDQNSGMEGTTRKIYSFSNRPAKTDVQKGSRDSQSCPPI
ncbi:hypothetical protein Tco_0460053 [Tanacetum coccineum]